MGAGLDPPFENHVGHDNILRKCPFDMWTMSGLIQKTLYVHYFTLMSSEIHYLDIILKMKNLQNWGKIAHTFLVLPVYCDFVRVSVSSWSCWFTHFCRQNVTSCRIHIFKNKNLNFSPLLPRLNAHIFAKKSRKCRH